MKDATKKILKMLDVYGYDCFFSLECNNYVMHNRICSSVDNVKKFKECEYYRGFCDKYINEK